MNDDGAAVMDERRDLVDREELRRAVRVVLADHFPMTPLYRVNRAADAVLAVPAIAAALARDAAPTVTQVPRWNMTAAEVEAALARDAQVREIVALLMEAT